MAYTVEDFLVEQAPQIGHDINQKMMAQPTPWITLYSQETWADQKSSTQKTFVFDRVKLTDPTATLTDDEVEEVEWARMASDVTLTTTLLTIRQLMVTVFLHPITPSSPKRSVNTICITKLSGVPR